MQSQLIELRDTAVLDSITRLSDISLAEYVQLVTPLLVYVAGMSVYALFVFSFYRYLARRDPVRLKHVRYLRGVVGTLERAGHLLFNFIENVVVVPVLVFFWFAFMATVLLLLSKRYTAEAVLLISAAVVSVVRICAYYTEDLSQDVAKMIPFALLGIFVVDMSYFDWESSLAVARRLPAFWTTLVYYLAFIVGLEVVLRTLRTIFRALYPEPKES